MNSSFKNKNDAKILISSVLSSGKAAEKFSEMISELGGAHDFFDKPHKYLNSSKIKNLEFVNKRRWDINLYNDVKLMLSEEDPNKSIQNFIMIQNKLSETDINNIKTYDLRNLKKTILINLND